MPSNRKGHMVQRLVLAETHNPGNRKRGYPEFRRFEGWRTVATQLTKRQAMRAGKAWQHAGFEVRVLDPQGVVIWQR